MDWHSSGRTDSFRYMLVDPKTFEDIKPVVAIQDGGSIERNQLAEITASGSVPYAENLDIGNNLLRVYSTSTMANGESIDIAHGTFVVSTPQTTVTDVLTTGSADLYGMSIWLQQAVTDKVLTVTAGTNAVGKAASLVQSVGLKVSADPSNMVLSCDRNYDIGTTYLSIVNDLLGVAGFSSIDLDGRGSVLMRKYQDPSLLAPTVIWKAGEGSIFAPNVTHTFDAFSVPNRLVLVCARNEQPTLVAVAENNDPTNRYSIKSRGRTITVTETVDDIANQAALEAQCKAKLVDKTSAVESIEIEHTYEPYSMGDGALLEYGDLVLDHMSICSDSMTLVPLMTTRTTVRRFIRM